MKFVKVFTVLASLNVPKVLTVLAQLNEAGFISRIIAFFFSVFLNQSLTTIVIDKSRCFKVFACLDCVDY